MMEIGRDILLMVSVVTYEKFRNVMRLSEI